MAAVIPKNDKPGQILIGIFTILFLLVLWPYSMALFWAVILAILLNPVWQWMQRKIKAPKWVLALMLVLSILLIVIIPLIFLILAIPGQIQALIEVAPSYVATFKQLINNFITYLPANMQAEIQTAMAESANTSNVGDIAQSVMSIATSIVGSAASIGVQGSIMMFVLYYFFADGPGIIERTRSYLPFSDNLIDRLCERFVAITKATVLGVFVIAFAQGTVCGIILWILGVQAPIALGLATMIGALIPAVGSALVWVPVSIFLAVNGHPGKAVILLLSGVFIISMVDNVLRPGLVGRGARIPDFVVLVTTLGGMAVFGASGIVLGPMIAGICLSLWQMTKPEGDDGVEVEVEDAPTKRKPKPKPSAA